MLWIYIKKWPSFITKGAVLRKSAYWTWGNTLKNVLQRVTHPYVGGPVWVLPQLFGCPGPWKAIYRYGRILRWAQVCLSVPSMLLRDVIKLQCTIIMHVVSVSCSILKNNISYTYLWRLGDAAPPVVIKVQILAPYFLDATAAHMGCAEDT